MLAAEILVRWRLPEGGRHYRGDARRRNPPRGWPSHARRSCSHNPSGG